MEKKTSACEIEGILVDGPTFDLAQGIIARYSLHKKKAEFWTERLAVQLQLDIKKHLEELEADLLNFYRKK